MRGMAERGRVEYTGRAFHQDAMEAMRGDIVRAVIELLTNADDAYVGEVSNRQQKISVEFEHRRGQPWRVVVRDRACGMSPDELRDRIALLGGRTSGFELGEERRGNLGRGAKDVAAFGEVTFESVKSGAYGQLTLSRDGNWTLEHRRVTEEDRRLLGIPHGSGTVVTITVKPPTRCPNHSTLKRRISQHYQLRGILSDPLRRVELLNLTDGQRDLLTYSPPPSTTILEETVRVPGYPAAEARLRIRRLAERQDAGPDDDGRPNGILIRGRRAIYENTLFRFEGNPAAGWFAGDLICPYIDDLAREYDDRLAAGEPPAPPNNVPIITRRRDGLTPTHPFVRALRQVVEERLGELVADEEAKARRDEGFLDENARATLDRLAREVAQLVSDELRDIEAEALPGAGAGEVPTLAIIPPEAYAYMDEDRTLSVVARRDDLSALPAEVEADPVGVVELLSPSIALEPHTKRPEMLIGQLRIRPLIEDAVILTVRADTRRASAFVEVRPPRVVVEEEIEPPEGLEFERSTYTVSIHRERGLELRAPASLVADVGPEVRVESSNQAVIVRSPLVHLRLDEGLEFYRGSVRIEARALVPSAQVTARTGHVSASTRIRVTRHEEGPIFKIRLDRSDMGFWRAVHEEETDEHGNRVQVIKLAALHPALRPFLGDRNEGMNTPVCRGLIAEAVADWAARHVVSALYRARSGTEMFDADRLYREHYKRIVKFLPRFQRILGLEPKLALESSLPAVEILEAGAGPGSSLPIS